MQEYVDNPGPNTMYVGNTMIPPGEGKLVEVPARAAALQPAEPAGPSIDEEVSVLLEGAIGAIAPQLPTLSVEALDRMEDLERAGKNRKGLLDAISAERISRANAKLEDAAAAQREQAQHDAANELFAARLLQEKVPADATEDQRTLAQQGVDEAQAKVDALKPAE